MFTQLVKTIQVNRVRLAALLCGAAACLSAGGTSMNANAGPQTSAPLEARVSVNGNSTIVLGEPISLYYSITNISDDQGVGKGVGIGLGTNETQWYQLSLTDEAGRSAQIIPDERSLSPRGLHSTGTYFLSPNGHKEDHIAVTKFFQIMHPGKYNLVVQVHIPYAAGSVTKEASLTSDLESDIKSSNTTLVDRFVFPIMVTKADPARLEARANALREAATAERYGQKYRALLDALFSMPEAQAASSWKSLANNADRMDAELIADQLARIHSITTADLLVQMLDSTKLSADETSYIKTKINQNYNSGDVGLKAHIKSLAANRGIEMSDEVAIPQPSD